MKTMKKSMEKFINKSVMEILNILEAHNETTENSNRFFREYKENPFDTMEYLGVIHKNIRCIEDVARAFITSIYEYNQFFADINELYSCALEIYSDFSDKPDEIFEIFLENEDIRTTSDGFVRVLHY